MRERCLMRLMRLIEVSFEMERETKNTVRFDEVLKGGEPPKIGTL